MYLKNLIIIIFISIITIFNSYTKDINNASYSLVFVYLGEHLPDYLNYSISQARLFNKDCNIFVLINKAALNNNERLLAKLKENRIILVPCEDLIKSTHHQQFDHIYSQHNIDGYWKFTTERFFYIEELALKYNLRDIIQVECDVLLYTNLESYLPILHKYYKGIACPFQNDYLASVSFTYFADHNTLQKFVTFIPCGLRGQLLEPDMYLLASYKNHAPPGEVDYLPTISKDLIRSSALKNKRGEICSNPWKYWNHIEEFNSIFDNDGIGTFLIEGKWKDNLSFFNSDIYKFTWEIDDENRKIPYIWSQDNKYKYRINTLHIASKNLKSFLST